MAQRLMAADPKLVAFPAPPPAPVRQPHLRALKVALAAAFSAALLSTLYLLLATVPLEYSFECSRAAGTCRVERRLMFERRSASFGLPSLRDVRVRTFRPLRGAPRVALIALTDVGRIFIAEYRAD